MHIKKSVLLIFIFLISLSSWGRVRPFSIVIDPGHGGDDEGAIGYLHKGQKHHGNRLTEKELTLQISREIYRQLSRKYSTYLTRSIDKTLSLQERADIAEKVKADLFISVHVNAGHSRSARGFETYYLDNHNDVAVKKIESIENQDVGKKQATVNQILADLVIRKTAPQSKRFSLAVHKQIQNKVKNLFKIKDRGVKPGLFYVLALSKRPAVLLEVGFLSNPKEIQKIRNPSFQKKYAQAIVAAVDEYFRVEGSKDQLPFF